MINFASMCSAIIVLLYKVKGYCDGDEPPYAVDLSDFMGVAKTDARMQKLLGNSMHVACLVRPHNIHAL